MEILDDVIIDENLKDKEEDWRLFIGEGAVHYIPIWREIAKGKHIQFNLAAFFLWVAWAGYRKMYMVYFLLVFGKNLLFTIAPTFWGIHYKYQTILNILIFIIYITWGLFANYVYYKHGTKKIEAIKAQKLSESEEKKALREAGNVNPIFPVLTGIIIIIVLSL